MENEQIVKVLTEVDERSKDNRRRLDCVEKRQGELDNLVSSVAVIATKLQTFEEDIKEIKTDVKVLMEKPAQRWESVVDKVIMTILGATILFILTQIGL